MTRKEAAKQYAWALGEMLGLAVSQSGMTIARKPVEDYHLATRHAQKVLARAIEVLTRG